MQSIQIQFTASGANSLVGGFAPGDTARVPQDVARHLVEEARCAKYMPADTPAPASPEKPARKRAKLEPRPADPAPAADQPSLVE